MYSNVEHYFHGIFATFGAWIFSVHLVVYTVTFPYDRILSGFFSILAGIMTGFLSKILNKYFENQTKDQIINSQNCEILELQNRLQKQNQQQPSTNQAATVPKNQ